MPSNGPIVLQAHTPDGEAMVEFLQRMVSRVDVSYHKYGAAKQAFPHTIDALASALDRIRLYRETGNAEWLVDAANFLWLEVQYPSHLGVHFRATDSDESPGRISRMVGRTAKPNLEAR